MPRRRVSAAGLVFALLVLATVAAFAFSQRLKRDPLILDHVAFATANGQAFRPSGSCPSGPERIEFRVTRADHATVQVIGPGAKPVRTLARDRYLAGYNFFTFRWDGRERGGGIAPPGRYKLRVELLAQERNLLLPGTIRLHRAPRRSTVACRSAAKGAA